MLFVLMTTYLMHKVAHNAQDIHSNHFNILSFILFFYSFLAPAFSAVNHQVKLGTGYVSIWVQFTETS